MPVMIILRTSKATPAQYEAIREEVRWDVDPPEGAISHAISFPDGGAVEVNIWESQALYESFFNTRLKPVVEKVGVVIDEVQVLETYNVATGALAKAYVLEPALAPAE